ncbi:MAG: GxxExxY protein [Victivallales bacterium]
MGIRCKERLNYKSQDEFHTIDKIVTGYAFDIHNRLGRFCDEKIYQEIMAEKCRSASIKAEREVEIILTYKDFMKSYKLDLLVDNGIIYELKTAAALNDSHKQQLINYLLLTGIKHGKLINFRPASVEYSFVSTTLTNEDRYDFSIDTTDFKEATKKCKKLESILTALLKEWGAFLDCRLFNEALIHFLGGSKNIVCPVKIYFDKQIVGQQKMHLLDNATAFHLSGITRAFKGYEKNIISLIKHTNIKIVQWVNFNQRDISIKTIKNDSVTNDSVTKK